MNHTEYSEIENETLSDEHVPVDTESLQIVSRPRCESELRCYQKYVTTRNLFCLFVSMQLILLMLWVMNYEIIWYLPDGSMSDSGSGYYEEEKIPKEPVVEYGGPAHRLFASSALVEYSYTGLPEKNDHYSWSSRAYRPRDPHYKDTTYVGQSADEFIGFLGMILFIYICIRCTCGRDPYRR